MASNSRRKTRREKGSGTEWQDAKTKHWRWRLRHEGRSYYVSDIDRDRAKRKLAELKAEIAKGIDREGAEQLLSQYLPAWLDGSIKRNVKTSTYNDYEKRCKIYIVPTLGHYTLKQLLDPKLIRAWANAVRDNYAHSSAKQALEILTRALDQAVEDKLIDYNPARAVKPPRQLADETAIDETDEGQASLTVEQEALLLADVRHSDTRSPGIYVLYVLALRLGLRRGELLGLRWKDIDFAQAVLHVRQQVNHEGAVTTPKSKKARRDLPLTDDLVLLLREHKLRLGALGRLYVFPGDDGSHRKPRAIDQHFQRAMARLSLRGSVFHDLRHTAITRWRERGVDLEVAAALAGHSTIKVTAEIYSESTMERKRDGLKKASEG